MFSANKAFFLRSTSLVRNPKCFISNLQCRLKNRPVGHVKPSDFDIQSVETNPLKDGDFLIETHMLSLDPAMRGWMDDAKSYLPPVKIDEVMRALGVGKVIESKNENFKVGQYVSGGLGAQEYLHMTAEGLPRAGLAKISLDMAPKSQWLNPLGMPGMTAYFGLMDICKPKADETLVVSAASGAVGQTVGQLAKALGVRVVGLAGGKTKCDYAVEKFGFDACIDYKEGNKAVRQGLKEHCPNGIDMYFDNVGGEILDNVLAQLNRNGRIAICGAISQYNNTTPVLGPKNYLSLLINRGSMEGFICFDFVKDYPRAIQEIAEHMKEGRLVSLEDVRSGSIQDFPETLKLLFSSQNFGKLILEVKKD